MQSTCEQERMELVSRGQQHSWSFGIILSLFLLIIGIIYVNAGRYTLEDCLEDCRPGIYLKRITQKECLNFCKIYPAH
ncbi:unnamed protein product [Calicophoron daubneyi]|uniref:Uncharacterized protein n=1 Tax=Calicophoron daubneyi TaxID=300641 RepID=A0AAV2T1A6_CALDB